MIKTSIYIYQLTHDNAASSEAVFFMTNLRTVLIKITTDVQSLNIAFIQQYTLRLSGNILHLKV